MIEHEDQSSDDSGNEADPVELRRQFTGRGEILSAFESFLRAGPPRPVFALYGPGGMGKSYLLNYLRRSYCLDWGDPPGAHPHAFLDFRIGERMDAASVLGEVRRQLSIYDRRFRFPRFDLIWRVLADRAEEPELRGVNRLSERGGFLLTLAGFLSMIPIVSIATSGLESLLEVQRNWRRWRPRGEVLDWLQANIPRAKRLGWREAIIHLDRSVLHELMPLALAGDLADSTKRELDPVVLFFDMFETLQASWMYAPGERQLTYVEPFCRELRSRGANVMTVIAGRKRLHWGEVSSGSGEWVARLESVWHPPSDAQSSAPLVEYELNTFELADTGAYLRARLDSASHELIEQIHESTRGYPLAIGLVGDLYVTTGFVEEAELLAQLRATAESYERFSEVWTHEVNRVLLQRLMRQLHSEDREYLVRLLPLAAVPRWFDRELLQVVHGGAVRPDAIADLEAYCFVHHRTETRSSQSSPAFTLHPVIRQLLRDDARGYPEWVEWNRRAGHHFDNTAEDLAPSDEAFSCRVDALYHRTVVDPDAALGEVETLFGRELEAHRVARCEELLNAMGEVEGLTGLPWARTRLLLARLHKAQVEYDSCLSVLLDVETREDLRSGHSKLRVSIQYGIADAYRLLGDSRSALRRLQEIRLLGEERQDMKAMYYADWGTALNLKLLDQYADALELADVIDEELETLTPTEGDEWVVLRRAHLEKHRASIHIATGDYARAGACCAAFRSVYEAADPSLAGAYGMLTEASLLRAEGRFDDAVGRCKAALAQFNTWLEPRGQSGARRSIAFANLVADRDPESVREDFDSILKYPDRLSPHASMYAHLGLGELDRREEHFERARGHYDQVSAFAREIASRVDAAYALLGIAELDRSVGATNAAQGHATAASSIGSDCGHRWLQVMSNLILAACLPDRGDEFVGQARVACDSILRRAEDMRGDLQTISRVWGAVSGGVPVEPLFFNFPISRN